VNKNLTNIFHQNMHKVIIKINKFILQIICLIKMNNMKKILKYRINLLCEIKIMNLVPKNNHSIVLLTIKVLILIHNKIKIKNEYYIVVSIKIYN
jgi:hypothetical protein